MPTCGSGSKPVFDGSLFDGRRVFASRQAGTRLGEKILGFTGKPPVARPRPELICIVDSVDSGILVYRDLKRSVLFPGLRLFHWAKRYFEWHYLRAFR